MHGEKVKNKNFKLLYIIAKVSHLPTDALFITIGKV
jgi:hypothetical protein